VRQVLLWPDAEGTRLAQAGRRLLSPLGGHRFHTSRRRPPLPARGSSAGRFREARDRGEHNQWRGHGGADTPGRPRQAQPASGAFGMLIKNRLPHTPMGRQCKTIQADLRERDQAAAPGRRRQRHRRAQATACSLPANRRRADSCSSVSCCSWACSPSGPDRWSHGSRNRLVHSYSPVRRIGSQREPVSAR
jgi:hypothetical protein